MAKLYEFAHWRDVPDEVVAYEYAALSSLSPSGYRHFIAAYMSFSLRHLDSGENAVDSTIWSLTLDDWTDERMRAFTRSKWSLLDDAQRAAVLSFLRAAGSVNDWRDDDIAKALPSWDGSDDGAGDLPEAVAARAAAAERGEDTVEAWFDALNRRDDATLAELMAPGVQMISSGDQDAVAAGRTALDRLLARTDEHAGATGELELMDIRRVGAQRFALIAETADGTFFSAIHDLGDDGRIVSVSHTFTSLPGVGGV
jgi:hypothetical protein